MTTHFLELGYIEELRIYELERVLTEVEFKKLNEIFILEIGSGTGRQARKLAELGYHVDAIDLADSNYAPHRSWPIIDYDGKNIPFPNNYFDVVFSSNVLEHMAHVADFQNEIKRVLKPDGMAIHIVPSSSWRFWTNFTHYPFVLKRILNILCSRALPKKTFGHKNETPRDEKIEMQGLSVKKLIEIALFPQRHGEKGNALSELYYFSRYYWGALFRNTGWNIRKHFATGVIYSGYTIFGHIIPIPLRKIASSFLGSSCHAFVLTKR